MAATGDFFHVNFPGLESITQALVMQYNTMNTTWNDLKTQVPNTLSQWAGPAQSEWTSVYGMMESLIGEVGAVLGMAGQHTSNAHEDWLTAELDNVKKWVGLG